MNSPTYDPKRAAVALAIAGALVCWGLLPFTSAAPPRADDIGAFVQALEPLRAKVGPGTRVALLLPGDDVAPHYLTQYALAPAVVIRVLPSACAAAVTCADDATHLLVFSARPEEVIPFGARLGFSFDSAPPGLVLMRRPR